MSNNRSFFLILSLFAGVLMSGLSWAQQEQASHPDIYSGYYSQKDNYGEIGETTGLSHYVKFYPENRIVRLHVPFPYSKTVKSDAINKAFNAAEKKTKNAAYIRDKFGVMEKPVIAHLDTFRWVDGQVMYDCSNAAPCKIKFSEDSMIVIKPGIVLEREILYSLIKD